MNHILQQKAHRGRFCLWGLVLLLILVAPQAVSTTAEAQGTRWSVPQTIPGYDPETWPPILVADQNGTVHAFSYQWMHTQGKEPVRAIFYNRWTLEQGWTMPIDIILSPNKEARLTDAYLDSKGMFHIVFWGGDSTGADIYYSEAPAVDADDARAWSTPIIVGEDAGDPEGAVIVEAGPAGLQVIYFGRKLGNGLYTVNSKDQGDTWSDPTPLFFPASEEPNISMLRVIKGRSEWLHVIWGVYSIEGEGRGVYYTRSKDGMEWSQPVLLATAQEGLGTQTPTMIEHDDALIVLYNLSAPNSKIYMRRSNDNGKTWDDASITFSRHTGVNGALSLVVDSNGDLHLFFGERIPGSPAIHGMWHSRWVSGRWIEPEAVVKGPLIRDLVGNKGFDPYFARAVVSQGNVILVTWRTDPAAGPNGIWYSHVALSTPELPLIPLPTAAQFTLPKEMISTPPQPTQTRLLLPSTSGPNEVEMESDTSAHILKGPAWPLMVGLFGSILIILISIRSVTSGKR